ncbi:M10 family metallopeptidase C-terminal domain-containing protein [Benzoatithermus flavus]|uniref:Peptidase M10 serralysin C-terminal domain-containing protein n=1 Tax=Benzoatithermus flavus TaxID=3108223 RepID=A0ABU8XSG9_9PROT
MGIRLFVGGRGNDTLTGTNVADHLYGDGGNDTLRGNGGVDTLRGSLGNDYLDGGSGSDFLDGGVGNDVLYGGIGNYRDILAGHAGNDTLDGGGGDDTIDGGLGRDRLTGGAGRDVFYFSSTQDSLPSARDVITDFRHGDRIDLSSIDAKLHTPGGQDFTFIGTHAFTAEGQVRYAQSGGHTLVEVNTSGRSGAEMVIDLQGDVSLQASDFAFRGGDKTDHASDDAIFSHNASVNHFSGGGGDDYVYGAAGNDIVRGGGDSDMVRGGEGDDIVDGGPGDDILYGGTGRDVFVFDGDDGRDIIQDFTRGEDRLQFRGSSAEHGMADFSIQQSGADTVIHTLHGDEIILAGVHARELSAADFLFG